MFRCHVCGKTEGRQELVSAVFDIDGKPVRVEQIPATICLHCGEPLFSRDTTERVRRMVHGKPRRSSPFRWMSLPIDSLNPLAPIRLAPTSPPSVQFTHHCSTDSRP